MRVSVRDIIADRTGHPLTFLERLGAALLSRLIHEDELNACLARYGDLPPYEFLEVVVHRFLGCSYTLHLRGDLPPAASAPVFVSNHPLGGLDGLILLLALHERGYDVRVIVNDLLMYIEPLRELFVPVNRMGAQRREYVESMRALWASACPVLTFPAGACSRLIDGRVQDLPWHGTYWREAVRHNRPVVSIRFEGRNSMFFYRVAQLRRWLHIRFNMEMLLLPSEMFRARGRHFDIYLPV